MDFHNTNLDGVGFIVKGMKYHFARFKSLNSNLKRNEKGAVLFKDTDFEIIENMKHETVAYLNRMGQFYYFAKNTGENLEELIPNILKFLPLRMKYSAHRAIDDLRSDDDGFNLTMRHQLNRSFSTQSMFCCGNLVFQSISSSDRDSVHFDILEENDGIITEVEDFLNNERSKI